MRRSPSVIHLNTGAGDGALAVEWRAACRRSDAATRQSTFCKRVVVDLTSNLQTLASMREKGGRGSGTVSHATTGKFSVFLPVPVRRPLSVSKGGHVQMTSAQGGDH